MSGPISQQRCGREDRDSPSTEEGQTMKDLRSRCAVVTGGAGGIGYSMAEACSAEGMCVAVAGSAGDRWGAAADQLRRQGCDAEGFPVDVTDEESVNDLRDAVMNRFGDVGVLCNNAGVTVWQQPFLDSAQADWDFVFGVNVF